MHKTMLTSRNLLCITMYILLYAKRTGMP